MLAKNGTVKIGDKIFIGEVDDDRIRVDAVVGGVAGVKINQIPENVLLYIYAEKRDDAFLEYFGEIVMTSDGVVMIEYGENPKYYRGYLPIERYLKLLGRIAEGLGYKIIEMEEDTNYVGIRIEKEVDSNQTIGEVIRQHVDPLMQHMQKINGEIENLVEECIEKKFGKKL